MRQTVYLMAAVTCALASLLAITMIDKHPELGIIAVLGLFATEQCSKLYDAEKLKHIRSNADEDRPE